ncbi:hypothetical protein EJ04DRAFT_514811 [Polyplosphaeria fusca]|uniref:Uncharacterized protein n=1 Tax=Polyplosphaeria fusca TaxID=682080 RepID=A0A9P4QRI2_9PLEO|nr:hypothetical protein EJ04DRAFT_514811 [Polyplosphaeria fusca]
MQAFGLMERSVGKKRSDSNNEWKMQQMDDIFTVDVSKTYFKNWIKDEKCGKDGYINNQADNQWSCADLLHKVTRGILDKMEGKIREPHKERDPRLLAQLIHDMYSTYWNFIAFRTWENYPGALKEKLYTNMKHSLVSKAYQDQQCLLKCTRKQDGRQGVYHPPSSSVDCLAGCFDPLDRDFERLYGFPKAERPPWNITERRIAEVSYASYLRRDPNVWRPGDFHLTPYGNNVKDLSPILTVCSSDEITLSGFPCTCGDKYGSESRVFFETSPWFGTHEVGKTIHECRGNLRHLVNSSPGAYLINMCHIVYSAVAPDGTHSAQEQKDGFHWGENKEMCEKVVKFWRDHRKGYSDAMMNKKICMIWDRRAKDKHRDIHSSKKEEWSHINHDLRHGGCSPWYKSWDHSCKKGKNSHGCDYPDGY